jgi:2,6-dihydroxypyridine 3-monooxygenase
MPKRLQVIIVGGSIAGVIAAVALRAAGCDVDVLERRTMPLRGRGAGLRLREVMVELLQRGADLDLEQICTRVELSRYWDRNRRMVREDRHTAQFIAWDTLHARLMAEIPAETYHLGADVVAVEQRPDTATVRLADGSARDADLVVFADGTYSTGRALLVPDSAPVYAGYLCWRGLAPASEMQGAFRALLDDAVNVALLEPSYFGAYPIPGADASAAPGSRLYNWVWYRNLAAGAPFDAVMTDSDGVQRASSIPPGKVRAAFVDELRAEAIARLPPPLAELVSRTARPFIQTICDVETPRMVFGRACLIGDAAFGGRPHLGAGTAKAAVDAWTLGAALAACEGDVGATLAAWEPAQLDIGRDFVAHNRRLGEQFQFGTGPVPVTEALRPQWSGSRKAR